jgi:uncharacterized peroxidase-related enzyme
MDIGKSMPWIRVINEAEASGKLDEAYKEIGKKRGKLSNIMKIHSLNPDAMKKHMELYLTLMFGQSGLSREEREIITLAVSTTNSCEYCIKHHAEALNHYWKDDNKIKRFIDNFQSIDFDDRKKKMIDYTYKLTKTPSEISKSDIKNLRSVDFKDDDILNINLIACYFNFVNRIALGLGVELSKEEASGYNY